MASGIKFLRKLFLISVLGLCALSLVGCGDYGIDNHRSQSGEAPAGKLSVCYDASVPNEQKKLMEKDLAILSDAGFLDQSETNVLDIPNFSNQSLKAWLQARYNYLVGESFDENGRLERSGLNYQPFLSAIMNADEIKTIMMNAGGGLYLKGKETGSLFSMTVCDRKVLITTPRVGIIQIGEGLFSTIKVGLSLPKDDINSYVRLATLFHEGRHADGNGDNAAFPHEECPDGDYAGKYACDKSLDGPYPVGRVILQKFRNQCGWCTSAQLMALDLQLADLNGRMVPGASFRDDRAERINP